MVAERRDVKVVHGANDGKFEVAGYPLVQLRATLVDAFNIPADAIALANGRRVSLGYIAQAEDVIEFVQERGEKGGRKKPAASTPDDGDGDEQPVSDSPATSRDGLLDVEEPSTAPPQWTERQILHGATSDAPDVPTPHDPLQGPNHEAGDPVGGRVAELLDHVIEGFRYDEGLDLDKLTVARNYGPYLLELKASLPHQEFMKALRDRYPKISYAKCNRWMFIARRENEVQLAVERYPGVAWGLKRMIAYLTGRWSPESETDAGAMGGRPADDADTEAVVSADRIQANENASDPALADDEGTGDGADSNIGSEQQAEDKHQDGTNVPDKKFKKLMGRFKKGGDMHEGGKTKTAQPTNYRVTVVTPEKSDLEKFGALLPSPITDLKAHSVTAWVRVQDIASTLVSVGSALTANSPKKVRVVVEL